MTLGEAAEQLRRLAERLPQRVRIAERLSLMALRHAARDRSRGGASYATLRRAKHPFARRRHSRALLAPEIINVHEGRVLGGWMTSGPEQSGDTLTSSLFNEAPQARYLWDTASDFEDGGTKLMFGRPVHLAAAEATADERFERLERAVEDAWEGVR